MKTLHEFNDYKVDWFDNSVNWLFNVRFDSKGEPQIPGLLWIMSLPVTIPFKLLTSWFPYSCYWLWMKATSRDEN